MKRQKFLIDTCVCAYWLRNKYNIDMHINTVGMENCYISEITVAELKYGKIYGQLKGGPKYKEQNMKKFLNDINILPIAPVFDRYAEEKARLTMAGTPKGEFDLLIGCTAVVNKMILVTENVKDFKDIKNIRIENWIERHER